MGVNNLYPCKVNDLPTLSFVGGSSKNLYFNFFDESGVAQDVSSCIGNFAIVRASYRTSHPVVVKRMSPANGIAGSMVVSLSPSDTLNLEGKHFYQISVTDGNGVYEEPKQGELYITRNYDKTFFTE